MSESIVEELLEGVDHEDVYKLSFQFAIKETLSLRAACSY